MIFEKFHRLGDELRRATPGTGLGLYIVKRLVELSGGTVHAASAGPGRGATVSMRWPAAEPRNESAAPAFSSSTTRRISRPASARTSRPRAIAPTSRTTARRVSSACAPSRSTSSCSTS